MRNNRFLLLIAHPVHGRVMRLKAPGWVFHVLVAAGCAFAIALIGLSTSVGRYEADNSRLLAENDALKQQYENLQMTVDERDRQLESLTQLAYDVSIAYGFRRDEAEIEAVYGIEARPAFYASVDRYDRIKDALANSHPGSSMQSLRASTTPSIWPVKGHITSAYGMRKDPFHGKGTFHPGLDISAPYGTPVVAAADGNVLSAEWEGALGHCIKITHGASGFETVYGHLKEYFVRSGQAVRRGEIIGLVGRSGRTTGKHLHYEVHYNRMNVNPYRYLQNRSRTYETSLAD